MKNPSEAYHRNFSSLLMSISPISAEEHDWPQSSSLVFINDHFYSLPLMLEPGLQEKNVSNERCYLSYLGMGFWLGCIRRALAKLC